MNQEDRLNSIRSKLREFVSERDWEQFHDSKNLAMAISSECGELLAELRWTSSLEADARARNHPMRGRLENEVADVMITLILFCERTGIDLLASVERKIEANRLAYPLSQSTGQADRQR